MLHRIVGMFKRGKKAAPPIPCLGIEINDSWSYWRIGPGGPVVCEKPANEVVWRISEHDYLTLVQSRKRAFLRQQGRNALRATPTWVFYSNRVAFTHKTRARVEGNLSRPITAALIQHLNDTPAPALLSIPLPDNMVAITAYKRNGDITGWTVTNIEDEEIIGARIAQNEGIVEAQKITLPRAEQLIGASPLARAYPIEAEWLDMPVRVIRRFVALACIGVALIPISSWLSARDHMNLARQQLTSAQHQFVRQRAAMSRWDRSHVDYLADKHGINIVRLVASVNALSVPGGRASVTKGGNQIVIYLPERDFGSLTPGQWVSRRATKYALSRPVPKGWRFSSLVRSGAQGQYALVYDREPPR